MKKFIIIPIIIFLVFLYVINSILGNDEVYYTLDQDVDQIEQINVLFVDWDAEEVICLGVIPPENYQEFISELTQLPMSFYAPPTTSIEGLTYDIVYYDGEYESISSWFTDHSTSDSETSSFCFNDEQFEALWKKYGHQYED